jgi:hypothetical protein
VSGLKAKKTLAMLDDHPTICDAQTLERATQVLSSTIEEEMSLREYFEIPPDRARFFDDSRHAFGEAVAERFFSTTFDAAEASRCYALGRNTACVFHLMRVMEIGLTVLARPVDVSCEHRNWHQVINDIERAVHGIEADRQKPENWREEREFFQPVHELLSRDQRRIPQLYGASARKIRRV